MAEYQFTQDWFHWAPELWQKLIPLLPERKMFLEIGSFEGRSMVWIAENMVSDVLEDDDIHCIDTWDGGEEHNSIDMAAVEARFDHNASIIYEKKLAFVHKYKGTSVQHLARWLVENPKGYPPFDFIYIDGSHIAKDVLTDACMAWPLLKPKGIMVFDDYMWGDARDILHRPKWAIDAFVNIFAEEVEIISAGYQLAIRKKEQTK
jgi:predicted O-methyltransferase YrrM